jgi:orotidine-5'-phosphate decarboxylase
MNPDSPIILAVDTTEIDTVTRLIDSTSTYISIYKFGLEFYLKHGAVVLLELQSRYDFRLFLDLKLHDIPNTVSKAANSVAELNPYILTVHAAGGGAMVSAACEALPNTYVAAVTVLTSLEQKNLDLMGFGANLSDLVPALAKSSVDAGARAIVASPHEVATLKLLFPETLMITPGIRAVGDVKGDQSRVMSARDALDSGSDYLVIGRPITAAPSPGEAARQLLATLS